MKAKRLLSWLLTLAMLVSLVPGFEITAAAAEETTSAPTLAQTTPTITQSDTKENTNQAGGIIYTKTSTAKSDGTIDITLTAHTTGVVKQLNTVTPTDIVLVLDVSGSMEYEYDSFTVTTYDKVYGSQYTYYTLGWFQLIENTAYGFDNSSSYYINLGTEEEPVYTRVSRTGRDDNGYEYFSYSSGSDTVYVYPVLTDGTATNRANAYSVYQFHSMNSTTTDRSRMDVLKGAVESFIDTTATMNQNLPVEDMHTISIVKFADDSYYNSTVPTVTEGNHFGAGGNSGYNYSEVVKNLTAVDESGAEELKTALASLEPGGATAVDYGLFLAEAVLMNRSAAVSESAVDRNEVIIVFTDGEPNHGNNFDTTVANTAIATAGKMESEAGVTVYGVSVAPNADAADMDEDINKFMHYMSSNYPEAESMSSAESGCDMSAGYYMTPDDNQTLTMIFDTIIQDIDHPVVKLGEEATMVDTVSPYFDFENGNSRVRRICF